MLICIVAPAVISLSQVNIFLFSPLIENHILPVESMNSVIMQIGGTVHNWEPLCKSYLFLPIIFKIFIPLGM